MIVAPLPPDDPAARQAAAALVQEVTDHDGVAPLSEHALLHLRHPGPDAVDLVARDPDGRLVGVAHLDTGGTDTGPAAELAVHPEYRRRGVATALLDALEKQSRRVDPAGRLLVWAHGDQAGAAELARRRGYAARRALWRMGRPLTDDLPDAPLPAGVRLRTFGVGRDEAAWTALNNRAFAGHPEQGRWQVADLLVREREPWFDPAGFLLAERVSDGELVGFHWTKVHAAARTPAGAEEPVGEVYVVGVAPEARGGGLAKALTVAGLRHLRSRGLARVMLYVDGSNAAAIAVYTRLGFTRWDVDVQYGRDGR